MCLWQTQSRWLFYTAVSECPLYASGKPVNKVQRLTASPGLMLHSSLRSCSHFKRTLIPFYMYDSWWVCSKAFRFIIKWMKQYLCESKLIQMFARVSCCVFARREFISLPKMKTCWLHLVGSNQWHILWALINDIMISSYFLGLWAWTSAHISKHSFLLFICDT